jgi:hypothetical protein
MQQLNAVARTVLTPYVSTQRCKYGSYHNAYSRTGPIVMHEFV